MNTLESNYIPIKKWLKYKNNGWTIAHYWIFTQSIYSNAFRIIQNLAIYIMVYELAAVASFGGLLKCEITEPTPHLLNQDFPFE